MLVINKPIIRAHEPWNKVKIKAGISETMEIAIAQLNILWATEKVESTPEASSRYFIKVFMEICSKPIIRGSLSIVEEASICNR